MVDCMPVARCCMCICWQTTLLSLDDECLFDEGPPAGMSLDAEGVFDCRPHACSLNVEVVFDCSPHACC